jgi:uncharacterized membrane protein (UPF0127 family)
LRIVEQTNAAIENSDRLPHHRIMNWIFIPVVCAAASLAISGCHERQGAAPPLEARAAEVGSAPAAPRGEPQAKLPTIKLWLGLQEILAEQALTFPQITNGMMFRTEMAEQEGMLFVFARPHRASFWMRNTLLPLSCAYIDPEGVIVEIRDMKPLDETPIEAGSDRVQYVLEMNQGWFERNKVAVGTVIRTERGTLQQTYFR